jgi:serine acetyltransferase
MKTKIKMIKKITIFSGRMLALSVLGHVSICLAADGFVEDFSAGNLPPQLQAVGGVGSATSLGTTCCNGQVGGPVFGNGQVRFQGLDTRGDLSGGLRSYLRTIQTDYSSVNFVAEVTVTVPPAPGYPSRGRNIVFFGLGPVLPVDIYGGPSNEPDSSINIATLPDNFFPRFQVYNATDTKIDAACGGNGTHRMRLEWNAQTKTAVTSIDQDYTGGNFVADCQLAPITSFSDNIQPLASAGNDFIVNESEISGLSGSGSMEPNGNQQANGRIYIGGDWNAIFDDFTVTINPAPVNTFTYQWTQVSPASPVITLSDPTAADPTFTAPVVDSDTSFTFQLEVSSGGTQATDTVNVTVANVIEVDNTNTPLVFGNTYVSTGASAELNGDIVANTYLVAGASTVVKGTIQTGAAVTIGATSVIGSGNNEGDANIDAGTAITIGAGTEVDGKVSYGTALTLGAGATIDSSSNYPTQIMAHDSGKVINAQDYFNSLTATHNDDRNILESTIPQDLTLEPAYDGATFNGDTIVYNATSLTTAAGIIITLKGSHDWVFNITDMLSLGAGTKIVLADNSTGSVTWNVGGYASIGANAEIVGTILARGYVSTGMGSKVTGADINSSTPSTLSTPSQSYCGGLFSATSYVTIGASGTVSCD